MEHTTRLREKIQIHFPELKEEKVGRNYILRHEKNKVVSNINDDHINDDQELDALAFHRFAKNLRTEISKCDTTFKGSFPSGCQEQCIPPPLHNYFLFGSGKNRRYIAAHKIAIPLGRERCVCLRGFHAFTGCDSVSFFVGKGKKQHGKHGCHVSQQPTHLFLCLSRMTTFQVTFKHFLKTLYQ